MTKINGCECVLQLPNKLYQKHTICRKMKVGIFYIFYNIV